MRRREFLKSAAAAIAAPRILPSGILAADGRRGANEKHVVAVTGVGGMGTAHLNNMLQFQKDGRVRLAAVCDADEKRLGQASKTAGPEVTPYRDYRFILERKDIDACIYATPDHWHAVQTVHTCESGKHVYVEKPACVTVEEGKAMVAAARKNDRAVQIGAQGRSARPAHATATAIRNGIVGKVKKVTCWHYGNPVDTNPVPDGDPPASLDWDLWLGPLSWRPYNPRWQPGNFRWFLESGGGQIRDRGAHQFSTILWCMDADGPRSFTVEATGTPPPRGIWDCPVDMEVTYTFRDPEWTLVWGQPGEKLGQLEFGNVFWGETDKLILEWEGAYKPASGRVYDFQVPPGGVVLPRTTDYDDFNMNHKADWFRSIENGTHRPAVDVEIGYRTAVLCILGNIAYILGRKLVWDGAKEEVVGDPQANRMLGTPQRNPYHL
ncbi:MAG: Gfo/Idh/MocA family oxidoreductase [Planctomycetes bacterium]|nr:Gfo/Idh/MocA family oxidoreductase [Planctomycetota bacterium]